VAKPKLDEVLGYVPLFHDLPKRHLKQLASLCDVAEYMPDAAIVKEGEPGDAFFVVLKGQAKVTVHNRFVQRLLPGDHFGEIAVLDGGERTATVRSETPMQLVILTRRDLMKALKADPSLSVNLLAELSKMIRRLTKSPVG
jgi:CRP/FNR family transcriptional regulator, cyclic AMP receptor protein